MTQTPFQGNAIMSNNVHSFPVATHPTPLLTVSTSITSKEISELVGKLHDNVKRTIESLLNQSVIARPQIEEMQDVGGNHRIYTASTYRFIGEQGKRDSIVVVAQLSPEFTARLVDRWLELEQQAALNAFNIPDTLHGALQLAADLAKEESEAEAALALAAPKVRVKCWRSQRAAPGQGQPRHLRRAILPTPSRAALRALPPVPYRGGLLSGTGRQAGRQGKRI